MANKNFNGKVFKNYEELRKILPDQNGGVVVIKGESGLKIHGRILTENDGNYKRELNLAKSGTQMLNPGKIVEVFMV